MAIHLKSATLNAGTFPTREQYPFNLEVLQRTGRLNFDTPVTFFVGENGTGKSTLLQALATASGIHIWRPTEGMRYESNPHEDRLWQHLSVEWSGERVPGSFFGADNARHFACLLDEWAAEDPGQLKYFGGKSLVTQSHGQSLMSLFRARYCIRGLYFLDEPEAALSPRSQIELLKIITESAARDLGQFVISTHSPLLMACPGAVLYSFDRCPVAPIAYQETEHYRIYRNFLTDRSRWIKPADRAGGDGVQFGDVG